MGKSHSKPDKAVRIEDATVRDEVDLAARAALQGNEEMQLHTKVQINLSARDLSKQSHYVILGFERIDQSPWNPIGFTEVSALTAAPSFVKSIVTDYSFEAPQRIRLELYRLSKHVELKPVPNSAAPRLPADAELVSAIDCALAEAVAAPNSRIRRTVDIGGELTVFVEEIKILQNLMKFDLKLNSLDVSKLPVKHRNKKAKRFYFSVYRSGSEEQEVSGDQRPQVIKTEPIECTVFKDGFIRAIDWSGLSVSVNSLCRGHSTRPVTFELWVHGAKGDDRLGSCSTTYKDLEESAKANVDMEFNLSDCGGSISIAAISIERRDSFLDYITGGLEMSLFLAIDFTKSNKDPGMPGSLHSFTDPDNPNDYVRAIRSVVEILQHYDSDKRIPVYGFGARLPPSYTHCSHCFACNGDYFNPEVTGIDEVIRVYRQALSAVALHGPTNFHDVVKLVGDFAEPYSGKSTSSKQQYFVLLILTDGVITDMKQTINEIVRAADFPMSVVVVGIGDEDFGLMKMLDGDDQRLYSTDERRFAARDIVQFVAFNKFKDAPMHALAMETLQEIPREVVNYYKERGVVPGKPATFDGDDKRSYVDDLEKSASFAGGDLDEEGAEVSDVVRRLEVMKNELIVSVGTSSIEIDEFEIYRILNEDKVPACDLAYFTDVANKAARGANVFSHARMTSRDTPESSKSKRLVRDASGKPSPALASGGVAKNALPPSLSKVQTVSYMDISSEAGSITGMCKVCFERRVDTVLVPCGHAAVCSTCGDTVGRSCPVCRKEVTQIVTTHPT